MLKAVQLGRYRNKNGRIVITYTVSGPKVEIEKYFAYESARRGVAVDQIAKTDAGLPIMHVSEQNEFAEGRTPQPSYDLIENYGKTQYVRDTTKQEAIANAELDRLTRIEMAKLMAERRLGVNTRPATTLAPATPATQPEPAGVDEADIMAQAITEGALGTANVLVPTGDETLGD